MVIVLREAISSMRLRARISVLLVALLLVSLVLSVVVTDSQQMAQAEKEMVEKARILSKQMNAVWDFMDAKQDIIDTDADGSHNFKGLNCAIAGKEISRQLTGETDYTIKYTNMSTRKSSDSPDSFEQEALLVFLDNPQEAEYYRLETGDERVFRYASPLWIKESCLECHGDPVGELDVMGYPKEGMKEGDLAGIMSIAMPVDLYMDGIQANVVRLIVYVFLVMLGIIGLVYWAFTGLVTKPLSKLETAAVHLEEGRYDSDLNRSDFRGEIRELADRFQSMAKKIEGVHADLEQQVADRTEKIAEANAVLEEQQSQLRRVNELLARENEYKSEFLATVSHELRTPLTSILAYADLWERSLGCASPEDRQAASEIKSNSRILLSMVNNILEMARAEAGRTEVCPEPLDMVDLINEVEKLVSPIALKKNLALSTAVDGDTPIIYADREKVRTIVENLVANAVKFTPEGGSVSIAVSSYDEGEKISIQVVDTGIGVSEADRVSIFEKFRQGADIKSRGFGGSGLGLAVVKQLAESHGGSVGVRSSQGNGSVFEVILPVEKGDWREIE